MNLNKEFITMLTGSRLGKNFRRSPGFTILRDVFVGVE